MAPKPSHRKGKTHLEARQAMQLFTLRVIHCIDQGAPNPPEVRVALRLISTNCIRQVFYVLSAWSAPRWLRLLWQPPNLRSNRPGELRTPQLSEIWEAAFADEGHGLREVVALDARGWR